MNEEKYNLANPHPVEARKYPREKDACMLDWNKFEKD